MDLSGKTALITGTNRGLGAILMRHFAEAGANIIAHARHQDDAFVSDCAIVGETYGVAITPIAFDVTDTAAMQNVIGDLIKRKMRIDAVVNSAGVAHGGYFQLTPVSDIRRVFDVNFFAVLELTQALLRYMVSKGGGSVINIVSVNGIDLQAGQCAYGVSKAALAAFTTTLAAECGPLKVRVNALAPGLMNTEMGRAIDKKSGDRLLARCAMHRLIEPEEVAKVAVFLASDAASAINGQVISIDGGKA